MDRDEAIDALPATYARALRLRESGADDDTIARALGIEAPALDPLLRLAAAKLQRLMTSDDGGSQQ